MSLLAHITKIDNKLTEQTLKEHCLNAARFGSDALKDSGFYNTVKLACLLHDMGKAKKEFNEYMEKGFEEEEVKRGSVNHTFAGVIYILEKYHEKGKMEKLTSEIIAYGIGAHHGLFDCIDLDGENGFSYRLEKDRERIFYDESRENYFAEVVNETEIDEYFRKAVKEVERFYIFAQEFSNGEKEKGRKFYAQLSMFIRFILSCVIYGDRKDTSDFMAGRVSEDLCADWQDELDFLEEKIKGFDNSSLINQVRRDISDQCRSFSDNPPGIYKLEVPTGGGKTLSTLRYALAHGEKFGKRRIIFIIPLLSVLDQNVKVFRDYLKDEDLIFEHHSNVIIDESDSGELNKYELLADRWDSPVIVSTMFQLLEILFGGKTSYIGRMRALYNSVIVIDEVQQLPKRVAYMFNAAINFLKEFCNATIILSSATQPVFENLDWPMHIDENADMVKLSDEQMQVFDRVDIFDEIVPHGRSMEELAQMSLDILERDPSLLVICNTKRTARDLFTLIRDEQIPDLHLYHLSTGMCQEHRVETLVKIMADLKCVQENDFGGKEPFRVLCVSTQLVEAGIDFSFKSVIRILAGIDNLSQSAGRCNRSGEYEGKGNVYIVNLKEENVDMLKEIKVAQTSTKSLLARKEFLLGDESLISSKASKEFYKNYFNDRDIKKDMGYKFTEKGEEYEMIKLLGNKNDEMLKRSEKGKFFLQQPFKAMGKHFKVFDDNTTDVIVSYGKGQELIERLDELNEYKYFDFSELKKLLNEAKHYTVNLYERQKERLYDQGLLRFLFEDRVCVLDEHAYDNCFGLNDKAELTTKDYMI